MKYKLYSTYNMAAKAVSNVAHQMLKIIRDDLCSYQILGTLHIGEFSKVLLGVSNHSSEARAIKIYSKTMIKNQPFYIKQIREQIKIMEDLGASEAKEFFVPIKFVLETRNFIYLGSPFCQGGSLKNIQQFSIDHTLSAEQFTFILVECVLALYNCHKKGIIHRDIKPENYLVDPNGFIRLNDFEYACRAAYGETLDGKCGTVSYVSVLLYLRQHFQCNRVFP